MRRGSGVEFEPWPQYAERQAANARFHREAGANCEDRLKRAWHWKLAANSERRAAEAWIAAQRDA